jgi:hypothetical protein
MKIAITGSNYGLGKNLSLMLSSEYQVINLKENIEKYVDKISEIVNDCDIFINCEYNQTFQTILFEQVYNSWKMEKKTIINILTSALIFSGPNKKYIEDKKDLEKKTFQLRDIEKEVRIINVYPTTLESSENAPYQKLKFSEVSKIIKWVIETPQDIEIFQLGISKTRLKIDTNLI